MSVLGTENRIRFCEVEIFVEETIVVPIGLVKLPVGSESCTSNSVPDGNPEWLNVASKPLKFPAQILEKTNFCGVIVCA